MHNYGEIVAAEQSNEDNNQCNEPKSDGACHTDANSEINDSQNVEKIEDSTNDTIQIEHEHTNDDEENNTSKTETEWQAPVSLKGFKKKLNEIFTVKCVTIWLIFHKTALKNLMNIFRSPSRCTFSGCVYYFENDERRQMHERYGHKILHKIENVMLTFSNLFLLWKVSCVSRFRSGATIQMLGVCQWIEAMARLYITYVERT